MSSWQILEPSTVLPIVEGTCGSEVLGFLPVRASRGDGIVLEIGVTQYWSNP